MKPYVNGLLVCTFTVSVSDVSSVKDRSQICLILIALVFWFTEHFILLKFTLGIFLRCSYKLVCSTMSETNTQGQHSYVEKY